MYLEWSKTQSLFNQKENNFFVTTKVSDYGNSYIVYNSNNERFAADNLIYKINQSGQFEWLRQIPRFGVQNCNITKSSIDVDKYENIYIVMATHQKDSQDNIIELFCLNKLGKLIYVSENLVKSDVPIVPKIMVKSKNCIFVTYKCVNDENIDICVDKYNSVNWNTLYKYTETSNIVISHPDIIYHEWNIYISYIKYTEKTQKNICFCIETSTRSFIDTPKNICNLKWLMSTNINYFQYYIKNILDTTKIFCIDNNKYLYILTNINEKYIEIVKYDILSGHTICTISCDINVPIYNICISANKNENIFITIQTKGENNENVFLVQMLNASGNVVWEKQQIFEKYNVNSFIYSELDRNQNLYVSNCILLEQKEKYDMYNVDLFKLSHGNIIKTDNNSIKGILKITQDELSKEILIDFDKTFGTIFTDPPSFFHSINNLENCNSIKNVLIKSVTSVDATIQVFIDNLKYINDIEKTPYIVNVEQTPTVYYMKDSNIVRKFLYNKDNWVNNDIMLNVNAVNIHKIYDNIFILSTIDNKYYYYDNDIDNLIPMICDETTKNNISITKSKNKVILVYYVKGKLYCSIYDSKYHTTGAWNKTQEIKLQNTDFFNLNDNINITDFGESCQIESLGSSKYLLYAKYVASTGKTLQNSIVILHGMESNDSFAWSTKKGYKVQNIIDFIVLPSANRGNILVCLVKINQFLSHLMIYFDEENGMGKSKIDENVTNLNAMISNDIIKMSYFGSNKIFYGEFDTKTLKYVRCIVTPIVKQSINLSMTYTSDNVYISCVDDSDQIVYYSLDKLEKNLKFIKQNVRTKIPASFRLNFMLQI